LTGKRGRLTLTPCVWEEERGDPTGAPPPTHKGAIYVNRWLTLRRGSPLTPKIVDHNRRHLLGVALIVDNKEARLMAIFFARAKIISRSNGQNAVACAAYRSWKKLIDRTEERVHDYRKKSGILAQGIAVPAGAPDWMKDREALWSAVEQQEKRKDAQLAREFILAVPDGLGDKRDELTREVVRSLTDKGMVVDWSLHEPSKEGDDRNFHWHLMATMRHIIPEGFGAKAREWNTAEYLDAIKQEICQIFNRELLALGLEAIDWRSYEIQGIERAPQEHEGPEKTAIKRKEARELARLERQIKAKEKERQAYEPSGESGRTGNEADGAKRRIGRTAETDRGEESGTRGGTR